MYVNIIKSYRNVIAIADKELVGKTFEEENKQLNVKKSFYQQENSKEKTKDEICKIIEEGIIEDSTFNLVGEKTIKIAIEKGLIGEESIKTIQGIPYAMILL
jgi:hypothetical protein